MYILFHPLQPELVSHLFFECDYVLNLWQQVRSWLESLEINLELDRTKLLFGVQDENSLSVKNYIILTVKHYIWKTKFQNRALSLTDYQHSLKIRLEDHKNACFVIGEEQKFEPWLVIFNRLEQICTDTNGAPLPPLADQQVHQAALPPHLGTPKDHPITHPTELDQEPTALDRQPDLLDQP